MTNPALVDLGFPLQGNKLPVDHGYALYGALAHAAPAVHGVAWLGVHPIGGTPVDNRMLLVGRRGELRLRLPAERIPDVLMLAGARLDVGGSALTLGAPRVYPLVPAASLDARLVVIKLTAAPHRANEALGRDTLDVAAFAARYEAEIGRQLAAIDVRRPFALTGRRSMTVAGRRVVGYSVRVAELSAAESLRLQAEGLGGKRSMGCGLFRATRGK